MPLLKVHSTPGLFSPPNQSCIFFFKNQSTPPPSLWANGPKSLKSELKTTKVDLGGPLPVFYSRSNRPKAIPPISSQAISAISPKAISVISTTVSDVQPPPPMCCLSFCLSLGGPMRLSVYTLYVGACVLAVVAAILSGVILLGQGGTSQVKSTQYQLRLGAWPPWRPSPLSSIHTYAKTWPPKLTSDLVSSAIIFSIFCAMPTEGRNI